MTTTNAYLAETQQKLDVGEAFVWLYSLDVSSKGAGILYWTPDKPKDGSGLITWQGNAYTSVDIEASGFEKTTSGTLPRPQLSIGNADNLVGALLSQYGDVKGCQVTRTKVLYSCLDGQANADATAEWPTDIFRVERKISQNKNKVVIELAPATDNMGAKVPGRPILRDVCTHIYRTYDGSSFNYTCATCPYAGTSYFNSLGAVCSIASDVCGKRLSDCKLRFGSDPLPFAGFPGVDKVRTS
jgi:lambda family phage minor tail protein L